MRLGLLVCDHVHPDLRSIAGDYNDMFAELFSAFGDLDLVEYDLTESRFPSSVRECDAWITTGSKRSVYENEGWIHGLADLVREFARSDVPFVGVCFGHQMMAHALGGEVRRSPNGWGVGSKVVHVPRSEPWMEVEGWRGGSFRVLNSHADQVDKLPRGAEVLGSNEHCPVSVMRLGPRMLGIQGHPEFVPEYSRRLMEVRRGRLIPETVVDAGLASLDDPPDQALLARWIVGFVVQALEVHAS
ncbi:MAG: gamma-glutamyl-gamma-aminobutyrate hydrolase family protein [Acidimicrobiia bacterium]|nr:gamma-glutamyl-gamma-aminobutyrate hydrolase family protein [Acidimicrobiia bacterium]MDH5294428.1 gamma-glutamyl-gamma-aminobutyrate hydrolase family protein [Acidimicrobiia bacterium]